MSRNKLEVATTACVRPELLKKTYSSLNEVLVDIHLPDDGVLYINIDPVPKSSEEAIERELEVARTYFSEVHYNIGVDGGNFSRAANWALLQPEMDYFFFCEDDWEFYEGQISVNEYITKMEEDERDNMLQCVTKDNGGGNRAHFPPSLFNNNVLKPMLEDRPIPDKKDPEQWLIELKRKFAYEYNVTSHDGVKRRDIGRDWAEERNIRRDFTRKKTGFFYQWDLSDYEPKNETK